MSRCSPEADAASERHLASARRQRDQGYLNRALAELDSAAARCDGPSVQRLRGRVLDELWLRNRPVPAAGADDASNARALALYRDAVNLRFQGRHQLALKQLERAWRASPHPLMLVQMGRVHEAAGDPVEARRWYARALAVAERMAGARAQPSIEGGHEAPIARVAISPDGRRIATAGRDGALRLWDRSSGRMLWERRLDYVGDLDVSPDGASIAVITTGGTIALVDAVTGESRSLVRIRPALALRYLPSGNALVVAGDGLTLVSPATGKILRRIEWKGMVRSLAVSHDGKRIAVSDLARWVAVLGTDRGDVIWRSRGIDQVPPLALSKDGSLLAIGGYSLRVVDIASGRERWVSKGGGNDQTRAVAISPSGEILATSRGFETGTRPVLWRLDTGDRIATLPGTNARALAFGRDDSALVVNETSRVAIYDVSARRANMSLGQVRPATVAALTPSGNALAVGYYDGTVGVWAGGKAVTARVSTQPVTSVAVAPDGTHVVVGSGSLQAVDAATGRLVRELAPARRAGVAQAWFSPSGRYVYGAVDRAIQVWDGSSFERVYAHGKPELFDRNPALTMETRAATLYIAYDRTVERVDVAAGKSTFEEHDDEQIRAIAITRDGGHLLSLGGAGIKLWELDAERLTRADSKAVSYEGFLTGDGKRLVTIDGTGIHIRDADTWKVLHSVDGRAAAASHDGTVLAAVQRGRIALYRDGENIAVLHTAANGSWVVYDPRSGAIDGGSRGHELVHWTVGRFQLPGFVGWQRNQRSGLLRTILAR